MSMTWRGISAWHFYKVLKSGTYSVAVNLGGAAIQDTPRSGVEFIAGAVDALSCSLDDQGQLTDGRGFHSSTSQLNQSIFLLQEPFNHPKFPPNSVHVKRKGGRV